MSEQQYQPRYKRRTNRSEQYQHLAPLVGIMVIHLALTAFLNRIRGGEWAITDGQLNFVETFWVYLGTAIWIVAALGFLLLVTLEIFDVISVLPQI